MKEKVLSNKMIESKIKLLKEEEQKCRNRMEEIRNQIREIRHYKCRHTKTETLSDGVENFVECKVCGRQW